MSIWIGHRYASESQATCRTNNFFGEQCVPSHYVDIADDPRTVAFVEQTNNGSCRIPTIVFPDGSVLIEPSNAELAKKLGMQTRAKRNFHESIIIGGGPTGLNTAVYLAREGTNALVIEKAFALKQGVRVKNFIILDRPQFSIQRGETW